MLPYAGYLILSDVDDTLTRRGEAIEDANLSAIRRFQAGGGRFTLCTGRSLRYVRENAERMYRFVPNAPVATQNGTLLCTWEGEILCRMPMPEGYEEVLRYVLQNYGSDMRFFTRIEEDGRHEWEPGSSMLTMISDEPVFKYVFFMNDEPAAVRLRDDLRARWGDRYAFDRSWPEGLEMIAVNAGKGACVRLFRELLPDVHTIIAVGDYENDVSMLREADVGCAMGNALETVKAAADRVICRVEAGGIAYVVDRVIPELEKTKR